MTTLVLIPRPDPLLHVCDVSCVPCARPGCGSCDTLHADGHGPCSAAACGCVALMTAVPCESCTDGQVEFLSYGTTYERSCDVCHGDSYIYAEGADAAKAAGAVGAVEGVACL